MSQKLSQLKRFTGEHKKQLVALIIVVVIAAGGLGVIHETLRVDGLVTNLTANEVTVADIWGTRTVTIDDSWLKDAKLKVGDRVDILQNWQGRAVDIRVENFNDREMGKQKFEHHDRH